MSNDSTILGGIDELPRKASFLRWQKVNERIKQKRGLQSVRLLN